VLAALFRHSCFGRPALDVLSSESCSALSFSADPVLAVMFRLSFAFCSLFSVLPWLSYSGSPVLAVVQFCLYSLSSCACPVLPFLFCLSVMLVLFYLPNSACPLLPVLFCLSSSACPLLPVLCCLSSSTCPVLPVPFCMSCSCYSFLAVDSSLSCPGVLP
jgi:hypothetical protein